MRTLMRQGAVQVLLLIFVFSFLSVHARAQDSNDAARKILIKTQAVYPTLARSMNIHGVAKLEVTVEPSGNVKSIAVKGGHPLLTQSAVTAVGHWKFEAAPRETKEIVEVHFDPE
jgi:TonB family protein